MRVLVAGATGQTGSRVTEELIQHGHEPVALVRESSDTSRLPREATLRYGNLESLDENVADDVDAVIFAAGSGSSTGPDMTEAVDRDGARRLIDIATEKKLKKFVMLSSIGADDPAKGPEKLQHYLQAKHEADEHLRDSGLPYTIIRPVALTNEDGSGHVELGEHVDPNGQVARGDVAKVLALSLTKSELVDMTVEMTGR